MESLKKQNDLGKLKNLTVHFVGPAYNASKADNNLSLLQGRETMTKEQAAAAELKYQAHKHDPVSGIIGWNKSTGAMQKKGKIGLTNGKA